MTQEGSRGTFSGMAMQVLGDRSTFSIGLGKLGLRVARSPPQQDGVSGQERKKPTCGKAETLAEGQLVFQNPVLGSRCQDPGPFSPSSASVGYSRSSEPSEQSIPGASWVSVHGKQKVQMIDCIRIEGP